MCLLFCRMDIHRYRVPSKCTTKFLVLLSVVDYVTAVQIVWIRVKLCVLSVWELKSLYSKQFYALLKLVMRHQSGAKSQEHVRRPSNLKVHSIQHRGDICDRKTNSISKIPKCQV
jgi:hypothetical protein